jgi:hypothetical protein
MTKSDNPAGRLYTLQLGVKSQPPNSQMRTAWAAALGLPDSDVISIYSNLVRLNDSLSDIEKDIGLQDVDTEIYLQHLPKLRQLLSLSNLDVTLASQIGLLNEGVLMTLQFCSERLSKTCPEKVPSEQEMFDLVQDISDLAAKLEKSDINKILKITLSELLESMRQAIAEYRIRGGRGLRQELFYVLERLQRTIPLLNENKDVAEVKSFWGIVEKYDTLTSICVNAPAVIAGTRTALLALGLPVS